MMRQAGLKQATKPGWREGRTLPQTWPMSLRKSEKDILSKKTLTSEKNLTNMISEDKDMKEG